MHGGWQEWIGTIHNQTCDKSALCNLTTTTTTRFNSIVQTTNEVISLIHVSQELRYLASNKGADGFTSHLHVMKHSKAICGVELCQIKA